MTQKYILEAYDKDDDVYGLICESHNLPMLTTIAKALSNSEITDEITAHLNKENKRKWDIDWYVISDEDEKPIESFGLI